MNFENLITEVRDGIGWIVINRPDKLNALNTQTVMEMHRAFLEFKENDEINAIILTGSGEKAFIAGADISELAGLDSTSGREYVLKGQELTRLIDNCSKPVIAAVNGFALGGGTEIALACHVRIASDNAKMGQPEVKLGLIPGFGGTQRLARLVGKGKALELILTGKAIDAQQAFEIGLLNQVVPQAELYTTCEELAREITANGPLAVGYAIEAINRGLDIPLEEALLLEAELFGKTCATEDSNEGTKAFLEKRRANFQGK
jgi:enoyl-CoA hydratase